MITRFVKIAVAIAVAALTLTACSSGETFPMASAEGLAKIRELVAEHVDTSKYKIYMVEWREDNRDRKLENILTHIDVYYLDADNNDYYLSFQLTNGKFTTDGPEQDDRQTNSYACSTPLDLAAIDFDYLQKIGEKADALVMSDEKGKHLTLKSAGIFRFQVWPVSLSNVAAGPPPMMASCTCFMPAPPSSRRSAEGSRRRIWSAASGELPAPRTAAP